MIRTDVRTLSRARYRNSATCLDPHSLRGKTNRPPDGLSYCRPSPGSRRAWRSPHCPRPAPVTECKPYGSPFTNALGAGPGVEGWFWGLMGRGIGSPRRHKQDEGARRWKVDERAGAAHRNHSSDGSPSRDIAPSGPASVSSRRPSRRSSWAGCASVSAKTRLEAPRATPGRETSRGLYPAPERLFDRRQSPPDAYGRKTLIPIEKGDLGHSSLQCAQTMPAGSMGMRRSKMTGNGKR